MNEIQKRLLKSEMAKKDLKVYDLARITNRRRETISLKLSGKNDFTASEILAIKKELNLSEKTTCEIFID